MAPDENPFLLKKAPSGRLFYCRLLGYAALAFAIVCWLNPNHYPPWVVFENEAAAFSAVLLAALAILVRGRKIEVAPPYIVFVFFIALASLAQYSTGMISGQVMGLGGLYLGAFAISIVVGYALHGGVKDTANPFEKMSLTVVLLTTIVSSGVVLGQWFHIESYYPLLMSEHGGMRPYGNLGQPNNQGTLLLTGVLCVELLLRKNAIKTSVACFSMLALLPALAATGSRTAIVGAVVAAAYLVMVGRGRKFAFTLGWLVILLVSFVLLPKLGAAGEADTSRYSAFMADSPRLHIYSQLMWAISDKPWTGYGLTQTAYAQSVAAAHVFGGVEAGYAHNVIIDFLVWFGIPLGVLLLLSFGFAVANNWRKSQVQYKIAYVLFFPFAVHSLLEFPFAYAFFLLPAGVLLGYLGGHGVSKNENDVSPMQIGWLIAVPLLVLTTCLAAAVCVDYLELAEDFRVLRFENRNVGAVPEGFTQTTPLVLTDMRFMMDMIRYKPRAAERQEKVEKIREYVFHSLNPSAHVKLISLEILDQHLEAADREIHRFRNLYGEGVVNWGMDSLRAAYCEGTATPNNNSPSCCALPDKQQCRPSLKLDSTLLKAQ